MRVLVIGADGFIGARIVAELAARGHQAVCCGRNEASLRRRFPGQAVARCDLGLADASAWLPRLNGIDAVVNAAGILRGDLEAVHHRGPAALFDACAAAFITKVIQISALGADASAASRFHRTKRAADEHLTRLADDQDATGWCVVRPSLVIGRGGQSTALFSALAALPWPVRLGPGSWPAQAIHVADTALAIVDLLETEQPLPRRLDLVGPEPMTTDALTLALRRWLGLAPTRFVVLPEPLLRFGARLGDVVPGASLSSESLGMLERGNVADVRPLAEILGWTPRPLALALAAEPSSQADLWHASLMPVRPLLRWGLALVWIGSGVVSAFVTPRAQAYALLSKLDLPVPAALGITWAGAALDIVLGAALLVPGWTGIVGAAQIATMALYTILASVLVPAAWADPFAPLLKNIAVLVATLALMGMERRR